jgi:hypothetical protein
MKYWIEGKRKQIINGQAVEIKEETDFDRFERHMKGIRKAQGKKCFFVDAEPNERNGEVMLDDRHLQGRLF